MRKEIWKFKIDKSICEIQMPKNSVILTCQIQNDIPFIWVLVDPEEVTEKRVFEQMGTGESFDPRNMKYISTIQQLEGRLVFHIYERY